MKLIFAAALALLAAPAFADDATTVTCQTLMAMDAQGVLDATTAVKGAMPDFAAMAKDMADPDAVKMLADACAANPEGSIAQAVHVRQFSAITCADMLKMDAATMMATGLAMKQNLMNGSKFTAVEDKDIATAATAACTAHPEATVMDAMNM